MIDIEQAYKKSNVFAFICSVFFFGMWVAGGTSFWNVLIILSIPTAVFLVVVFSALLWSFILTRNNNVG